MQSIYNVVFVALWLSVMVSSATHAANILLFGGTRGVGLETARILVARGDSVTAFVRPTSSREGLEPLGVTFAVGDVLESESVQDAFVGNTFDIVITSLGPVRGEGYTVDSVGTANVVDASRRNNVSRFVMVSAIGVGSSKEAVPDQVYKILEPSLISKKIAEDYLAGSGLSYTIVRPGGLNDGPATSDFHLTEKPTGPFDRVNRGEVARLTVKALDNDGNSVGKIYHVAKDF